MKRHSFRFQFQQRAINDRLRIGLTGAATLTDMQMPFSDDYILAYNMLPVYPVYNADGSYFTDANHNYDQGNPVQNQDQNYKKAANNYFYGQGDVQFSILDGLTTKVNLYKSRFSSDYSEWQDPRNSRGQGDTGKAIRRNRLWDRNLLEWTANYTKAFGSAEEHKVDAIVGYSWENNLYADQKSEATNFAVGSMGADNIQSGNLLKIGNVTSSRNEYKLISLFARAHYSFKERYMITATVRRDGSSKFGANHKWGTFPSVSAAWGISQESFMEPTSDWLSNLKLRASWGKLGNNSIGNYEWQALYGSGYNYAFNSNKSNGLAMTTFSNYALEWEETAITNIGLDFGVLNNRLNGTIEVYDKKTDGILYRPTLPESLNQFTSPLQNLAGVNNKGLEITLGWNDRVGDISYSVSGNFTYNKNKVTKYKGELVREWRTDANGKKVWYQNVGTVANGSSNLIVEGHEMNEYYMMNPYKGNGSYFNSDGTVNINGGPKDGMIRTEADMKWLQAMFDAGYKFYPNQAIGKDKIWYGDMIYADYNGDGIYGNDDDRDFQGVSWRPKYYFGLQASMTWKGFDLSMNWAGAAGFKIDYYKQTQNSVSVTHGYGLGYDIAYDHYFFDPENPNDPRTNIYSETPRLVGYQNSGQASATSSWHLKNGNYIKLKNLTIGYTFPKEWMKVAFIQNARVYLSGENLLTITKFEGSDPERMAGDGYMPIRQYTVGVNVTF